MKKKFLLAEKCLNLLLEPVHLPSSCFTRYLTVSLTSSRSLSRSFNVCIIWRNSPASWENISGYWLLCWMLVNYYTFLIICSSTLKAGSINQLSCDYDTWNAVTLSAVRCSGHPVIYLAYFCIAPAALGFRVGGHFLLFRAKFCG